MKTNKLIIVLLLCISIIGGCKKAEKGDKGEVGPQGATGPEATMFTYTLTFTTASNYQTYSGITGFDANDVIITYVVNATYAGEDFYVQLPYVVAGYVNVYAEVGETTGLIFVNTEKADGTAGSPWTGSTTFKFKSVLIKSRFYNAHPEINYSNFKEVERILDLK